MFKRFIAVFSIVAGSFMIGHSAFAQTTQLSAEKETIIKQTCISAQTTIQKIQHNDAATRINRGQGYETMVSKLMTPLNSRATSNGYNDSATLLIETTKKYQTSLDNFKEHYKDYDNAISAALRIKCQEKPLRFYQYIETSRELRNDIAGDVAELSNLISEYRDNVKKLESESTQ